MDFLNYLDNSSIASLNVSLYFFSQIDEEEREKIISEISRLTGIEDKRIKDWIDSLQKIVSKKAFQARKILIDDPRLGLSTRAKTCIARAKIENLGELKDNWDSIKETSGLGPKTLEEIPEKVKKFGIYL